MEQPTLKKRSKLYKDMKLKCILRGHDYYVQGRPFVMGYLRGYSVLGQIYKCACCGKEKVKEL